MPPHRYHERTKEACSNGAVGYCPEQLFFQEHQHSSSVRVQLRVIEEKAREGEHLLKQDADRKRLELQGRLQRLQQVAAENDRIRADLHKQLRNIE
jgi:hypothetical protein